jgi:hypothetical protein
MNTLPEMPPAGPSPRRSSFLRPQAHALASLHIALPNCPPGNRVDVVGDVYGHRTWTVDSGSRRDRSDRGPVSLPRQTLRLPYGRTMLDGVLLQQSARTHRLGRAERRATAARTHDLGGPRGVAGRGPRLLRRQAGLLCECPDGEAIPDWGTVRGPLRVEDFENRLDLAARRPRLPRRGAGVDERADQLALVRLATFAGFRGLRTTAAVARGRRSCLSEFHSSRAASSARLGNIACRAAGECFRHGLVSATPSAERFTTNRRRHDERACAASRHFKYAGATMRDFLKPVISHFYLRSF